MSTLTYRDGQTMPNRDTARVRFWSPELSRFKPLGTSKSPPLLQLSSRVDRCEPLHPPGRSFRSVDGQYRPPECVSLDASPLHPERSASRRPHDTSTAPASLHPAPLCYWH